MAVYGSYLAENAKLVKEKEEFKMAVYGSYLLEAESAKEEYKLSMQDKELLRKAYIETCIAIAEDVDTEEYIYEGINLDRYKVLKTLKKDFRKQCSIYKKAIMTKDIPAAEKSIKAMRKLVDDADAEIKANKDSMGSSVIGFLLGVVAALGSNIGWILLGLSGAASSLYAAKEYGKAADHQSEYIQSLEKIGADDWEINYHEETRDDYKKASKFNKVVAALNAVLTIVLVIMKESKKMKENYRKIDADGNDLKLNYFTKQILSEFTKIDAAINKLEDVVKEMKMTEIKVRHSN